MRVSTQHYFQVCTSFGVKKYSINYTLAIAI